MNVIECEISKKDSEFSGEGEEGRDEESAKGLNTSSTLQKKHIVNIRT